MKSLLAMIPDFPGLPARPRLPGSPFKKLFNSIVLQVIFLDSNVRIGKL